MKLKYSLVIPALNGLASLRVTLPYMLSIPRNDFQIVISDNCSDDGSLDYLQSFKDSRLTVISPNNRLPHSEHLNFAYGFARGEWVNHMGDDDLIFSDRFERLDEITNQAEQNDCDIVIGKSIRYVWPENSFEPPNSLSSEGLFKFTNSKEIVQGKIAYRQLINTLCIAGGGETLIRGELVKKVIDHFGYFCPPDPYVEFFGLRTCCYFARNIMKIDTPLYINGRMSKSIGNALSSKKNSFNWTFENPRKSWRYCPIDTYSYCTISLDAALAVENLLGTNYFDKKLWGSICAKYAIGAARGTTIDNQLTPRVRLLYQCLTNFPVGTVLGIIQKISEKLVMSIVGNFKTALLKLFKGENTMLVMLSNRHISAKLFGLSNIVDVANWYPKTRNDLVKTKEVIQ